MRWVWCGGEVGVGEGEGGCGVSYTGMIDNV